MARRSQCSSAGDNPLDPNYLPPHYREEYRLAIDALVEEDLEGYYHFLQKVDVVDFLSSPEIHYIQNSVQVPKQSKHPEHRYVEAEGDGSSDTYWPIHSDLDAPGLDLGWPQLHHFIGPTEVTTLVNPPEPDMPNIKEQARRLIKNAQQVIAIVMDMFTDVDIFADILNAAMRNVAVYILLDQQNAHHFINMVSNCRVNLQNIQPLRVRTVSGITYHCRSGKSFKGQMMDRFLLTDCRAVLSGNYSFMWSFEKLHRCMAHLFLGQLVSTFDEEFRILFAQSQPLMIENMLDPMDNFSLLQKRQYPSEKMSLYREPKKFQSLDTAHPNDWARQSYDERMDMDWKMKPLKRQETFHGTTDMYSRFPSQQLHMDPFFDQGPSRMPMMENPTSKHHSYAEGVHGRHSYPFLQQQGMPEPENHGRQFHWEQQPYPGPGLEKEADYSGYDKFWNQDLNSADQYSEPGLPQEIEPCDNFDPVLNYLSSTRKVDFDQDSEKLPPAADLPFSSSHPRRFGLGQPYACQTSPTPSNPTDQKQFFQEPITDRKDPIVKRGLRNWRISSYLSAYDNPEDEGLPLAPPNAPDPFEESSNLIQQTGTGIDLSVPKIPNVREFRIPAIPRASQIPSYAKTTAQEQPNKLPDEPTAVTAETKITPTPSESSSTTEGEKTEEAEQKEPKTAFVQREESFRRKYSGAVQRSSRLRSSLIFSSLEQQHTPQDTKTASGQQDVEGDKNEAEQTKLPYVSQVLGQRRSTARQPFEWSRYVKSATFDSSGTNSSKPHDGNKSDDKDSSNNEHLKDLSEEQDSLKPADAEQANSSPLMPQSKPSEAKLPKTDHTVQLPKSLLISPPCVDMSNPDSRLMFFKELAAKRKAAKAAEAEKSKENAPATPPTELKDNTTVKKEEPVPKETSEKMADTDESEGLSERYAIAEDAGKPVSTEACESVSLSLDDSDKTNKGGSQVKNDPNTFQSCKEEQTRVSTDSENTELKNSQSAETEAPQSEPPEEPKLSNPAVNNRNPNHPPTPTNAIPAVVPSLAQGTYESERPCPDSSSAGSSSLTGSVMVLPSAALEDSNNLDPESAQLETGISSPSLLTDQHTGSKISSSNPSVQRPSSDHILPDSCPQISPSPSISATHSAPVETVSPYVTPERLSSTPTSSIWSPNAQETVNLLVPEPFQSVGETSQKPTASSVSQTESEATQDQPDSVSQSTSSKTPSAVDSAHVESDISPDTCPADSEPQTSLLLSSEMTDSSTPPEVSVLGSETNSVFKAVGEESELFGSSKDDRADSTHPSFSPPSPESCLPNLSDLESKSRSDPEDPPPEHPAETSSPVLPDFIPNASQLETAASPEDTSKQATPPSEHNLSGHVPPTSPLTESLGSVLSTEAEKTLSASDTNTLFRPVTTHSNEMPMLTLTETSSPTEPMEKVPAEPDLPCKPLGSVTSENHPSEPPVPAENSKMEVQNEVSKEPEMPDPGKKQTSDSEAKHDVNTQESVCNENTNDKGRQNNCSELPEITADEVVPLSPQTKQSKSSQSRYHSSTANVISSSNLRDDTKLLLEQISANSQSRNEAAKEAPVTDDEKEDEADKNAKRDKERGIGSLSRGQPTSNQEREKLLERIQSMRKERKVYSRFEMAP